MSDVANLISKFGAAIKGEKPNDVLRVLVSFTQVFLDRYGVDLDLYVMALHDEADPPRATKTVAPDPG